MPLTSAKSAAAGKELEGLASKIDRRLPVSDQVYEALRSAIISARLEPGASISENALVRQFGVSRTPIRAAIQRLSEEGLIDVFPQQGSFIAPIRLSDIMDSHFVRRALEVAIIEEVAAVWSPDKSAIARAGIDRMNALIATGDNDGFHAEDERFHELMAKFAKREGVWTTVLAAKTRLARLHRLFGQPSRLPKVAEEHLMILNALDAGNSASAKQALVEHLDKIFTMLDQLPDELRAHVYQEQPGGRLPQESRDAAILSGRPADGQTEVPNARDGDAGVSSEATASSA